MDLSSSSHKNLDAFCLPDRVVKRRWRLLVGRSRMARTAFLALFISGLLSAPITFVFAAPAYIVVSAAVILQREAPKSPFVFVNERGTPFSPDGFNWLVKRTGQKAGMPFQVHAHMLRHSAGYKLAGDGRDTRAVQDYLGHRNISNTVRYTDCRRRGSRTSGAIRRASNYVPIAHDASWRIRGEAIRPPGTLDKPPVSRARYGTRQEISRTKNQR
jgi:integrase-like protein